MKDDSQIAKTYQEKVLLKENVQEGILANMAAQAQHFGPEDIQKPTSVPEAPMTDPGVQTALEDIAKQYIGMNIDDPRIKRIADALWAAVALGQQSKGVRTEDNEDPELDLSRASSLRYRTMGEMADNIVSMAQRLSGLIPRNDRQIDSKFDIPKKVMHRVEIFLEQLVQTFD